MCDTERRAEIARLNDAFRHAGGGPIVLTAGIAALSDQMQEAILAAVKDFHDDADGEHRVGTLTVASHAVMWFILYHRHDHDDEEDADPADPDATGRVLVIMLEGEP
ncbi:MAG: DUF3768 domain-containing protein [Sphingomonas sp.]|uniref:DUF3768 domain-containing protein n=1 Tax=Sphingomonas sp. TaxID=28214 RepID=UPI0025FF9879|nr:DUF3768 domain-containing protein [Sphingomonas sp.]MBX9882870.1 DUF3768 domain-containing protein [Sphingomonas sp.]